MLSWKSHLCAVCTSLMLAVSLGTPVAYAQESTTVDKDETVYVYTDPVGKVHDITVKDLLANEGKKAKLKDKSTLKNIEPSSNDVAVLSHKGTALVWDAQGKQVQYKGTTTDDVPVSVRVSYTLDGHNVSAQKLAGKSGHVVIRIDYRNSSTRKVRIDGKKQQICTPFVAASMVSLDRDVFSSIKVTNGRLVDGSDVVSVVGYAMPGLQKSLDVTSDDLDIPDYVQIEADVQDFALDPILTLVTPELLSNMDTSKLSTDDLTKARDELSSAMDKLVDGADELTDGLKTLSDGQQTLADGISQLGTSVSALPSSVEALDEGAQAVASGAGLAQDGANKLTDGAEQVDKGIEQAGQLLAGSATALEELPAQLEAIGTGQGAAGEQLARLGKGLAEAQQNVEGIDTSAIQAQIDALEALSQQDSEHEAELGPLVAALKEALAAVVAAQGDASVSVREAQKQVGAVQTGLSSAGEGTEALGKAVTGIATGVIGAQKVLEATESGASAVQSGASELAASLGALQDGAGQVADGLDVLSANVPQLVQGIGALQEGADKLTEGTAAAAQGAQAYAKGVSTFDEEGVAKLTDKLDKSGVASLSARLKALANAADDYQSFSGLAKGQTGSVKFIIKTDAIGE